LAIAANKEGREAASIPARHIAAPNAIPALRLLNYFLACFVLSFFIKATWSA
jgi:hypothetical protein